MEERSFAAPRPDDADDESESPDADAVLSSEDPNAVARLILYLSWLRATGIVMAALATKFPDEKSWDQLMADPVLHAEIASFNGVVTDVRMVGLNEVKAGVTDIDALEKAGSAHYDRAIEALALTAERLGVTPDDLLVVLAHA